MPKKKGPKGPTQISMRLKPAELGPLDEDRCNLKLETSDMRVWLCRVERGVTVERLIGGRWQITDGDCTAYEASDPPRPELSRDERRTDARLARRGH